MFNYTKKNVNIITLIISIIFFIFINSIFYIVDSHFQNQNLPQNSEVAEETTLQTESPSPQVEDIVESEPSPEVIESQPISLWSIKIPIINLEATIHEGTSADILNKYVGHFEDTSVFNGNIGLAAHNRGYKVNYFENVKKLKNGDIIYYSYNGKEKQYIVDKIKVIKDTDWSNLENTNENKITLITCVEDAPAYRRCIQASEK